MRELKIDKWCDMCVADDPTARVPAEAGFYMMIRESTLRKTGPVPKPRLLEVCEPKHAEMMRELGATVKRLGLTDDVDETPEPRQLSLIDIEAPAQGPRARLDCPICERNLVRDTMPKHLLKQHDIDLAPQPRLCPDCGVEAVSPHGMRTHRRIVHGYDHLADMVAHSKTRKRGRKGSV